MPHIQTQCRSCGSQEHRYHNVTQCPQCGGPLEPIGEASNRDGEPVLTATQRRQIRDAREAQGLSRVALGKRAGLAYTTITQLENGQGNLRLENLRRLCKPLGLSVRLLLEPSGETERRAEKGAAT